MYHNDVFIHVILSMLMGISSLISFYTIFLLNKVNVVILLLAHIAIQPLLLLSNYKKVKWIRAAERNFEAPFQLNILLIVASSVFTALMMIYFARRPFGYWDAMSTWNLRPRFMFYSQDDWLRSFLPLMWATDYLLLLPLNILWGWLLYGEDTFICPVFISIIFTLTILWLFLQFWADILTQGRHY